MSCRRHTYCEQCDQEMSALLFFVWLGVTVGLCVLAWVGLTR